MKLYAYGDSWTEGVGIDWSTEQSYKDRNQLQLFRNKNSWVTHLANKMGLEAINNGWSGKANNIIFNEVINDLRNNKIKKDDFVVIMWSSSLRDYVPFLPKGEWISWGQLELSKLPNKYQTLLEGTELSSLSGGQKQRISIARALIRNPNILIFDEATSALDPECEELVQNTIKDCFNDKNITMIIIAHRRSALEIADKIYRFENSVLTDVTDEIKSKK